MITRVIELSCDEDGCDVAYQPSVEECTSLPLTRVGSAVCGWTQQGGLDFCPDHRRETRADKVRGLARRGLTDAEIGERIGIGRTQVQKIRAAHRIPPGRSGGFQ